MRAIIPNDVELTDYQDHEVGEYRVTAHFMAAVTIVIQRREVINLDVVQAAALYVKAGDKARELVAENPTAYITQMGQRPLRVAWSDLQKEDKHG